MSNQEILEKAIQKAIDGGWKGSPYLEYEKLAGENWRSDMVMGEGIWLVAIVYSPPHAFAKALWPEPKDVAERINRKNGGFIPSWQYHLQQMVISDDPIKYLGESI